MASIADVLRTASLRTGAYLSNAAVGNVGAGEDDLMSTTIPASTVVNPGDHVRIRAWGTTANNANAKTLKVYFGSATIADLSLTVSQVGKWTVDALVFRTARDTQEAHALVLEGVGTTLAAGKHAMLVTALTADEDASITVKLTGTGTSNDDIVQEGFLVVPDSVVRG